MSLSQLIEKRRQTHEVQDQQQRQQPMRGNAEYAAGARSEHDLQQWEQRREREYREQNLGKGTVTAAEIDAWHQKQGEQSKAQKPVDHKAERDWEAQVLPKMDEHMLTQQPQVQQHEQEQRRRMSR